MKFRIRRKQLWNSFVNFCFPRTCVMCGNRLSVGEKFICVSCQHDLPRTRLYKKPENKLVELFGGLLPIVNASSFIYYSRGSGSRSIVLNLKYYHTPSIGVYMGRMMATEHKPSGFFDGVDMIIPIPLARRRMRQRGYNQVEALAHGVSQVTGIPVVINAVERVVDNPSQTTLSPMERHGNVSSIFKVPDPELLRGKHILLMDDVVTTGATLKACGEAIVASVGDVKISVLTLAMSPSI